MKSVNSHFFKSQTLGRQSVHIPKIVLMGAPNIDLKLWAHRLAIDMGVPAISLKQIYKTLLNENEFSNSSFYRKVTKILKNPNQKEAMYQLENEYIPEKLLSLHRYSELGYILYDYPNNLVQAKK